MYYGEEAKNQVQAEWEECYESRNFDPAYKEKLDYKLLLKTITREEIINAINKTGAKGIA